MKSFRERDRKTSTNGHCYFFYQWLLFLKSKKRVNPENKNRFKNIYVNFNKNNDNNNRKSPNEKKIETIGTKNNNNNFFT